MPTEFNVYGNQGKLTVDAYTGLVLAYEPEEEGDYHDIFRFDVAEYKATYPAEADLGGRSVDILDIGFWDPRQEAGYTVAEPDYRARVAAGN